MCNRLREIVRIVQVINTFKQHLLCQSNLENTGGKNISAIFLFLL
jgi:hypothetical protein